MVCLGSPPIRMVSPGVAFLHPAEQFVFEVQEFQEYYKVKCMSARGTNHSDWCQLLIFWKGTTISIY